MQVTLVMFKADGTRRDFPIQKPRIVIGRTNVCDLRIPLSSVSRKHCEIVVEGDKITVRDMGSSNGTFLNNNRIQEATASAGDELVIGPVVFTIVVDGQPRELEPVRTMVQSGSGESIVVAARSEDDAGHDGHATIAHDAPAPQPKPQAHRADDSNTDLDDPIAALDALARNDDSGKLPLLMDKRDKSEH